MQKEQNLSQLLFRPCKKFGGKLQKYFLTKTFSFDQILYYFISFMTEIFRYARILLLPLERLGRDKHSSLKGLLINGEMKKKACLKTAG
jgi:hypothetical protein